MGEEITSSDHIEAFRNHPIKVVVCPNHTFLVMVPTQGGPYSGMGREEIEVLASLIMLLGPFEGYLDGSREKGRGVYLFSSQGLPMELSPYVIDNLSTEHPASLGRTMSKEEFLEWVGQVVEHE